MVTNYDDGPQRVAWTVTDNDGMARTFRIKDSAGEYVTDPDGDGWVFFGEVRDERGGTSLGEITFTFNGAYVTQTLPALSAGTFWWEKEVTPPAGLKRTTEAGPLVVLVDSAVDA